MNIAPVGVIVHADALEVPELVSELPLGFTSVVDATEIDDLTGFEAEVSALERQTTVGANLA